MKKALLKGFGRGPGWILALVGICALASVPRIAAQDYDDPPGRVARLGYMQGSVSFQPAGEDEWVQASPNRPMTTGDKIWADRGSRAEVQLGSVTINIGENSGFSFLNLDDRTIQVELSSGSLNLRVWDLDRDNIVEVDTPNQAFTVYQPGHYRLDASENGDYTVVTIWQGEGESTGNGQSYTLHAGQRTTFSGTDALNAEVDQIGGEDDFDRWSDERERRYHDSPSARYCSQRVVGYQDLDDNGDWRDTPGYGYAWYPRVDAGWAPYHEGHWAWIDPWGWTWVDDAPWGYAPFHYGRWFSFQGRWGWMPGPREERPVYAPALVAFVGGAFVAGGGVAWFPLGPREVYVPSYRVSEAYVTRVNVTNTVVNRTTVTNVYNTTIVNNNTTINNVTYANRNVQGAVTAVPQQAFASAQPVARNAVAVNAQQLRTVPVSARAAVAPSSQSVLGPHANTGNRVAAPPQAVANRPVIAKAAPPPPPPSFASRQQVLAQHPGQPVAPKQLQQMRPENQQRAAMVKQAPPAKPATATPAAARPAGAAPNQPGQPPAANGRPGATPPPANRPGQPEPGANNRPGAPNEPPARNDRPPSGQPNRPETNQPAPGNRPDMNRPQPNQPAPNERPAPNRPDVTPPNNRPQPNQPPNNRPEATPPPRNDRPAPEPNNNRPMPNQPPPNNRPDNRPEPNRPENNRPAPPPERNDRPPAAQPNNRAPEPPSNRPPERNEPAPRQAPPSERPDSRPPAQARPAQPPPQQHQQPPKQDEKKPPKDEKKQDRPQGN